MKRALINGSDRLALVRDDSNVASPLLARRDHAAPSIFRPENMLREARRQKGLSLAPVAPVCVLDPDGDIVDHVRQRYAAKPSAHWACYHTRMWEWTSDGIHYGIIGRAVGGSFSVMVAEQLFASGCQLLISVASAGHITDVGPPPYWILIERALRHEGTSYHYQPASPYADANSALLDCAANSLARVGRDVHRGTTWTTDAPFRETAESVALRRNEGIFSAVEMEAAGALCICGSARRSCLSVLPMSLISSVVSKATSTRAMETVRLARSELITVLAQAVQLRDDNGNGSRPRVRSL